MCSLCWLRVAENNNLWQILTFVGACTGPLLPTTVKFGVLKQTDRTSTLTRQISSECVQLQMLCQLTVAKNHNFGQIVTYEGSCTDPLLPMRAKSGVLQLNHGARLRVKIPLDRFILSPSSGAKPQMFAVFLTSVIGI